MNTILLQMTDIASQVLNFISNPAKAYNSTHYYQSFEVDPKTSTTILGDYTKNALGWITTSEGSGTGKDDASVIMKSVFNDLYDNLTAQLAVETLYSNQLFLQYNYFHNNQQQYNISTGLLSTIYQPSLSTSESTQIFFNRPYIDPTINRVIVTGQSDNFISLATAVNTTNLSTQAQNSTLFVEWFGFFKTTNSGQYTFQIASSQTAYLWLGDVALVNYNPTNCTSSNSGKNTPVNIVSGLYYPVRIKYVCNGIQAPFSVSVSQNGQLVSNGIGLFFTITDVYGTPYEPIQIHYALLQNTPESISASLFHVSITEYDITNNQAHNQKLRMALANANGQQYSSTTIATCNGNSNGSQGATLNLNSDGNLSLVTGSSTTNIQITSAYSQCVGGTSFQSTPALTMNNESLNTYYTVNEQNKSDTTSGLKYMSYSFDHFNYTGNTSDHIYSVVHNLQQTPSSNAVINSSSILGNETVTNTFTQPLGQPIVVTNLAKILNCTFTLQLAVGGNLIVSNGNGQIWDLFSNTGYTHIANQIQTMMQSAVQNKDWINIYTAKKQAGTDLQYLQVGKSLSAQNPLISSDGKCKLTIDNNNNLVLMTTTAMNSVRTYTLSTDPPNVYYLFSINGDMKLGKHMLVDTSNQTLQYVPINSNILNYMNTYKPISSHPPNTTNLVRGQNTSEGDRGSLAHLVQKDNMNKSDCESLCNQTTGCSYYFSYTTNDNVSHCIVNNDDTSPSYLPTPVNTNVKSSILNLRDKEITSNCNVNGYTPTYKSGISSDQFKSYSSYSTNLNPYNPLPNKEGACSDPTISANMGKFEGKEQESFVPGYNPKACQTLNSKQCLQDICGNLVAINQYSSNIQSQNTKINQMYHGLNDKIYNQYAKLSKSVNSNEKYDMIDANGNLLNNDKSLLGAMISDTKNRMISQNNMYIFANIALATTIIGFLTFVP